jgi:hypothetical protein
MSSSADKLKQTARTALSNTQALQKMILNLAARLYRLERKVNEDYFAKARIADWRSLAIMKLMDEQSVEALLKGFPGITEKMIVEKAEQLQVEDFEKDSLEQDRVKNLIPCDEESAANGHYAIGTMKVFKEGKELEEQRIVRTKFEIGLAEHFPEVDEAVRGLKVGESRRFKLSLQNKTDEAEFFLTGLRKKGEATDEQKSGAQGGEAQGS